MKHIVVFALCLGLAAAGSVTAGEMTSGLEMNGGQNAFAGLKLERVQDGTQKEGVLKLQVSMSQTRDLKGYGFVLQFDPAKYEFVEAKEATDNLLSTGSGQPTLFLSASHSPGQVTVGAMKVDGQAVTGEGRLLEVTFKTAEVPLPTDFQIAEGMLVDLEGNIDPIHHLEVGNLKPLPDSFGLDQNMPNPFNPSTTIGYQLPESGQVHLSVYNLLGQVVRTLVDGTLEAGYYTLDWDGRDDFGRQLASGIYLYRRAAVPRSPVRLAQGVERAGTAGAVLALCPPPNRGRGVGLYAGDPSRGASLLMSGFKLRARRKEGKRI